MLSVVNFKDIRGYSQLSDQKLFGVAQNLRDELENPKLTFKDYLNTFLIATIGPGSTIAAILGYFRYHRNEYAMKKPFGRHLNDGFDALKDEGIRGFSNYMNENGRFRENLNVTVSTFAISSILSAPLILSIQKREKAENVAIKLSHAERILRERGYETTQGGVYIRKPHFDEHGNRVREHESTQYRCEDSAPMRA